MQLAVNCDWKYSWSGLRSIKRQKKVAARLDIDRLKKINDEVGIPLVLHGGSGIQTSFIREAIKNGITKINIGTNIRQPYVKAFQETGSINEAQKSVYRAVIDVLQNELGLTEPSDG